MSTFWQRLTERKITNLNGLAWRNLLAQRSRTILTMLAVALGVAMTLVGNIIARSILNSVSSSEAMVTAQGLLEYLDSLLQMVGIIIMAVAGFMVLNSFLMSITTRRYQIGSMRALGMTQRQVMNVILREALFIGLGGILIGVVSAPVAGWVAIKVTDVILSGLWPFDFAMPSALTFIIAIALGIGISVVAVFIPARNAARVSPLVAMQPPSTEPADKPSPWPTIMGIVLMLIMGGWIIYAPPGDWVQPPYGTTLLLVFLLGWFASLTLVLGGIIRGAGRWLKKPLERRFGAVGRLVSDNVNRGRSRVTITVLTLVVSVALVTGMTGLIAYFSNEFMLNKVNDVNQLDAWIVTGIDFQAGLTSFADLETITLDPAFTTALKDTMGSRAQIYEMRFVIIPELSFWGDSYFSFVHDADALRDSGETWFTFSEGSWETAYPLMKEGCAVMTAPAVAARSGTALGEKITVTGKDGPVSCTLAGIGLPYVNASIISSSVIDRFDALEPVGLVVWPSLGEDRGAVEAALAAVTEQYHIDYSPLSIMADMQVQVVEAIPILMNTFLLLAMVAAALGIINTTFISVEERRAELGLMRAVGATRRQVQQVITGEAALMGLVGGGMGLVAGLGFIVLLATVYGGSAWGRPDLDLWGAAWRSVKPALITGIVGVLAAPIISVVAAYLPARSALRGSAIDTLDPLREPQPETYGYARIARSATWMLAWRSLQHAQARAVLGALSVAGGVTITIASDVMFSGMTNALGEGNVMASFISNIGLAIRLTGLVVSAAAGFLIYNSLKMSITQRQQEIGSLRSLGMARRQVMQLVVIEAAVLGAAGCAVGLLLGPPVGMGLLSVLEQTGLETGDAAASLLMVLVGVAGGFGITLIAGLLPARQAAKISPMTAIRRPAVSDETGAKPLQAWLGFALMVLLVVLFAAAPPHRLLAQDSINPLVMWGTLFGLWGVCILVFGLLLPSIVGRILALLRRPVMSLGKTAGRLAMDNLQRSQQRVVLMALAFAIGLAIVLWAGGQVDFVNATVIYSAERYLDEASWSAATSNPEDALATLNGFDPDVSQIRQEIIDAMREAADGLANVTEAHNVLIPEISAPIPGFPSFLMDTSHLETPGAFTFVEGDWESAKPLLAEGCGLLVASSVAGRHGVGLGGTIRLEGLRGPVDCTVAGIGSGNVVPASIVGISARDLFVPASQQPSLLNIRPLPGADLDELEAALEGVEDRYAGQIWVYRAEDQLASVLETSDQLSSVFGLMQLLAVVAAALGVANTTLQSIMERRREIGLLRAVGAARKQITAMILAEAVLTGVIGAVLGVLLGSAMTIIYGLTMGGSAFGVDDLPVAATTFRATLSSLRYGLVGIAASPILAAVAAYFPARTILRGAAIETLQPERVQKISARQRVSLVMNWGSVRARFALGTAGLLVLLLGGLIAVLVGHARQGLLNQMHDMMRMMVAWNAGMLEAGLDDDAQNLDLAQIESSMSSFGSFDADMMLRFETLMDDISSNGLEELVITDRYNTVVASTDIRQMGTQADPLENTREASIVTIKDGRERLMQGTTPVSNDAGAVIGSVRITVNQREVTAFLNKLRAMMWGIGLVITALGALISYRIATPLAQATGDLAEKASGISRGELTPYAHEARSGWFARQSMRTRLAIWLVAIIAGMVGILQVVAMPVERRHLESTLQNSLVNSVDWMGTLVSEMLGTDEDVESDLGLDQFGSLEEMLDTLQSIDVGHMQALAEETQSEDLAYTALLNRSGVIVMSDQFDLIGERAAVPRTTGITQTEWRGDNVWVVSTPLREGRDGKQVGGLQIATKIDMIDTFISEIRTIFRLFGIIALLAGVLMAQVIGGAVASPVTKLVTGTQQVAAGDLTTRFDVPTNDELAALAKAYNEMVAGLQEREWLRDMFGRFVSSEVVEAIRRGQVRLEGENRVVSVLFCDIRGFTSISELLTPQAVVSLLNDYLPVVVNAANQFGGTVNKFGGDSTLIIYGAPREIEDSAYQAVMTALVIQDRLAALNLTLAERGIDPIRVGVGINTGEVLAGAVGPSERQEYTVIGDTVNLASRIESLNKAYPEHNILISQMTVDALGDHRTAFDLVDLGDVDVRGKAEPVRIWAVKGLR